MKDRFTPKTPAETAEINRITKLLGDSSDYRIDSDDLATPSESFIQKALQSKKTNSSNVQKR